MKIKTIHADSLKEFKEQVPHLLEPGFNPTLFQVFSSYKFGISELSDYLKSLHVRVFGCTSCGEFIYDEHDQTITEGALVGALIDFSPSSFDIKMFAGNAYDSFQLGNLVGEWAVNRFNKPAIFILASGLQTDGEQLVKGVQAKAGKDITMFGGLAGDDARFQDTMVFDENQVIHYGALVMALDLDVYEVHGIATSGWSAIGAEKIITKSVGNIVYTIDDQPALDVYKDYLNVRDSELPEIGVEYPLLIRDSDNSEILRAVLNVDREQKSLIFAGSVPQGSVVSFSSSPGFEIIEMTRHRISDFRSKIESVDLLVLFSCMARHNALGPTISEEIAEAWEQWAKPLIGFFTYGEIGSNFTSQCHFQNETFTLTTIKEKR